MHRASARATETLRSATTGRTLTSAQKAAARRAVRSKINANAKAAFNSTQQSTGRNTAIIQGAGAATTTKTASEGSKSIISRIKSWWND